MQLASEDLSFAVETIGASEIFDQQVGRGPFAALSFRRGLQQLLERHTAATDAAMQHYRAALSARTRYQETAKILEQLGGTIDGKSRDRMNVEVAAIDNISSAGARVLWLSMGVGILTALGVIFFSFKTIALPIRLVAEQLHNVAAGEGDLTARLAVRGQDEVADLARSFNAFTARLCAMIEQLLDSIHRLSASTGKINQVAERTGSEIRRQQAEIDDIAGAMNELFANAQSVAGDTAQAADQAGAANAAVDEGQSIVEETQLLTARLSEEVARATEVINDLGSEGQRIEGVLDVIRAISEQTNLLALNAAIEAARAGEHGRGFAVVADEVRNLAARTHASTNEIRDMIERLQQGTRKAVEVMTGSRELSATNVAHAGRTREALQTIREAVEVMNGLNAHVAEMSGLQTAGAEAVNRNVGNIRAVAAATVRDAAALSSATEGLSRLTGELESLAGQFKV